MIAMIGTSDRLCWLAEICKILLLLLLLCWLAETCKILLLLLLCNVQHVLHFPSVITEIAMPDHGCSMTYHTDSMIACA